MMKAWQRAVGTKKEGGQALIFLSKFQKLKNSLFYEIYQIS